ncbi:MAG: cobalt-precorrin-6A reductase [Paracoccus sp. (in: a-proteobacteria)]|nr:cobalt-precorrin-6A reductase [Paracoccus sp. (in: a-proteobacteria)]
MRVLILGGTTEARAMGQALADAKLDGIMSLAGRVERPLSQPLPQRLGGFGGVEGLRAYLREHAITHVIDSTHPFAAQMTRNALAACKAESVPYLALTRAPWIAEAGDNWQHVPDIAGAVAALAGPPRRVMLAIGRQNLTAFAIQPQHFYLLRLVDPPETPLPLPHTHVIVDRGPFTQEADKALMQDHQIDLVVSKNAGGTGARAKLDAARALGLPVVMIDRPALPARAEVHEVAAALAWLHGAIPRGV